ncbi:MAG: sugar phosphate isomerase/epimerase family protein [Chitinophagales bacterium]
MDIRNVEKPIAPTLQTEIAAYMLKDDISLAQWALVDELRAGKWKNLDFPRIAREDFDLNGIEFVNTFFESPTETYLNQLKQNASDQDIEMVLIMVDEEGDGCSPTKEGRRQFAINHRKWVDIASFLGCKSIRTNCRGPQDANREEALLWAEESYQYLLDYAGPSGINILIENHGGVSNDPDWMVALFNKVNHPNFGSYPDWRSPGDEFDNVKYLERMLPFIKGLSFRNQPDDELTIRMIKMCRQSGYRGWYGIESGGREAIRKGIKLLDKWLLGK